MDRIGPDFENSSSDIFLFVKIGLAEWTFCSPWVLILTQALKILGCSGQMPIPILCVYLFLLLSGTKYLFMLF